MKNIILLTCASLLMIVFSNFAFGQEKEGKPGETAQICSIFNFDVEILKDTICDNKPFEITSLHSQIDTNGANFQCPAFVARFELELTPGNWLPVATFLVGGFNNPIGSFVGEWTFDIEDSLSIYTSLTCNNSYKIRYTASESYNFYSFETKTDTKTIFYDCSDILSVNISPNPTTTCDEFTLLNTNFSSDPNFSHVWHIGSPTGPIVSTDQTYNADSGYYFVYVEEINGCDSGMASAYVNSGFFETNISLSGPSEIVCDPESEYNFPSLTLDSVSNYSGYTFQWFYTIDGNTNPVLFGGTSHEIPQVTFPGDFFLVTTNPSTGCSDTSNVISISGPEPIPYTLSYNGSSGICDGQTFNGVLAISPKLPKTATLELYNGSTFVGNTLNFNSDGSYWAVINYAGCTFFSDTIVVDIDTLPIPNDRIRAQTNGNDIYCHGNGFTLINTSYPSPAGTIHELFINGINIGNIFEDSATYFASLSFNGWNDVNVITTNSFGCSDTLFEYRGYVVPDGCCNNLPSLTLLYGELDNGNPYNKDYLVVDDLTTAVGGSYDFTDGAFNFMGDAFHYEAPQLGGEATGPNIYLNDSAYLRAQFTRFSAFCDTMWGGIWLNNEARLESDTAVYNDMYHGIRPNFDLNTTPSPNTRVFYNGGGNNDFNNNFISTTYYANAGGYLYGTYYSKPDEMKFPYDMASNGGKASYSYKAIDIYRGNNLSMDQLFSSSIQSSSNYYGNPSANHDQKSSIINHIYGIYLNEEAFPDTISHIYTSNVLVAGVYNNGLDLKTMGYLDMNIYQPSSGSWQRDIEYDNNPALNEKVYGIFSDATEVRLDYSELTGDGYSLNTSEPQSTTVGFSNNRISTLYQNTITGLDFGQQIRGGSGHSLFIDENIMSENVVAINLTQEAEVSITLSCNKFEKHPNDDVTQYGILVDQGSFITQDIGGNGGFSPPAGNGWPVDPSSPGYSNNPPTTLGGGSVDIFNWNWPANWYSIYDANAENENTVLGYKYFANDNEFFGEAEDSTDWSLDAIYPSKIAERTSSLAGATHCIDRPEIIYPLNRVINGGDDLTSKDAFGLYPNPAKDLLFIEKPEGFEESFDVIIHDVQGRKVLDSRNLESKRSQIALHNLKAGFYTILLNNSKGEVIERRKLIIE